MTRRLIVVPLLLIGVAAGAFAAGRWSSPVSRPAPQTARAGTPAVNGSVAAPLATKQPAELRHIARLPFADSYRLLSSAEPELISRWLHDIVQIRATPTRHLALTSFFQVLIQTNPALAKKLFLELEKEDRWPAMYAITAAAPPRALEETVEVMRSFDILEISGCSYNLLRDAIGLWSDVAPEAVASYIAADATGELREYGSTMVRRWAAYDPAAARQWLVQEIERIENDRHTDDAPRVSRGDLISSFVEGWFEADRAAAVEYAVSVSSSEDARESGMLGNIAGGLFTDSPDAARAFIFRVAESSRANALRGVGWQEDMDGPPPHFVAEWLLQFPGTQRTDAMENALREWHQKSPGELHHWMNMLPPAQQSEVVQEYRPYASKENIAENLQHVLAVETVALRDQLLRRWMREGHDASAEIAAVLQQARLPMAQQQELITLVRPPAYATPEVED